MPSPIDKVKIQNKWVASLCDYETQALSMCQPVDLMSFEPEIIVVGKDPTERALFDYWRVVLSSEPQSPHFAGAGRSLALLVRDRKSGGFLGVVGLSDPPNHWTQLIQHLGWDADDSLRLAHQHRIVMMRRCLPVYEFGRMTGGKLLSLLGTSRAVIRLLELRYSFQYLYFGIRTLHGKGSQYNRLHQRGISLINVDETNHGFYAMELRKKALPFLRGEVQSYGKASTFTVADQVDYWQQRWLPTRMESLKVSSVISLDPSRYRLSDQLMAKRMTPARANKALDDQDASNDVELEGEFND